MKILLGSNLFGDNKRQTIAKDSWIHLKNSYSDLLELALIQYATAEDIEQYDNKKAGIIANFSLQVSSKDLFIFSNKKLPIVKHIFDILYSQSTEDETITHFGFINSDVILTNVFISYMLEHNPAALAASRLDIKDCNSFDDIREKGVVPIRLEPAGYDLWVFEKSWWLKNRDYFNYYLLGRTLFDVVFAGIIRLMGGVIYNNPKTPMICHIQHSTESHGDDPENKYNYDLVRQHSFDHLVLNVMHYHLQHNLCKYTPWGTFLNPWNGSKEFSEEYFDTMSFEKENTIKYIQ